MGVFRQGCFGGTVVTKTLLSVACQSVMGSALPLTPTIATILGAAVEPRSGVYKCNIYPR
jgi:hypothetical protein